MPRLALPVLPVLLMLPLLLLAFVAGCGGTLRISTDYDPATDFSRYTSFAWLPEGPTVTDVRIDSDLFHQRVRTSVETELGKKGMTAKAADEADLLVNYHAALGKELRADSVDRHHRYGRGWSETRVREYSVGTLIIDLVDARNRQLVWRGVGTDYLQRSPTPEKRSEIIRNAVERILATFPPSSK